MRTEPTMQVVLRAHKIGILVLTLILGSFWFYTNVIEPAPFYINYDPEVPYFMSSLSVFKGQPYTYIDHPGTPVEMLGSLLLALTYPIVNGSASSFAMYHLAHPEFFLAIARALLTLGSILCLVLLASRVVKIDHWTQACFSLAIAACFYAVHPLAFTSLVLWSHNSFNFPAGTLLLLALLMTLCRDTQLHWWQVSLLGISAGILGAVQLYFVTWAIGVGVTIFAFYLLQKRGWIQTLLASLNIGITAILGFIIATLPIAGRYAQFINWVYNLVIHQGVYGSGEAGFTSSEQFASNFTQLWAQLNVLFISAFVVVVVVLVGMFLEIRTQKYNRGLLALTIGLLTQLAITIVIIIKHPAPIYMLAVAAILPILLAIIFLVLGSYNPIWRALCVLISLIILFGFGANLVSSVETYSAEVHLLQLAESQTQSYADQYATSIGRRPASLTVLWTYNTYSKCYVLRFGNGYAAHAFSNEITQLCPNQLEFNIWAKQAILPDGHLVSMDKWNDWDLIVTSESMLRFAPYLADYGRVIVSEAATASDNHVVFILQH